MKTRLFLTILFGSILCACAAKMQRPLETHVPKITVALLPLSNQSNDLDAPTIVRDLMLKQLRQRGYDVVDINQTDEILKQNGISEGGQLNAITPQKLGEILSADQLMYGEIVEYNYVNVGVFRNRIVELEFKLINPTDGSEIWKNSKKVSKKDVSIDKKSIQESFIAGLAEKMVEKIISKPLLPEATEAVRVIASTLP
jgi:hypothetical protein